MPKVSKEKQAFYESIAMLMVPVIEAYAEVLNTDVLVYNPQLVLSVKSGNKCAARKLGRYIAKVEPFNSAAAELWKEHKNLTFGSSWLGNIKIRFKRLFLSSSTLRVLDKIKIAREAVLDVVKAANASAAATAAKIAVSKQPMKWEDAVKDGACSECGQEDRLFNGQGHQRITKGYGKRSRKRIVAENVCMTCAKSIMELLK